MAGSVLLSCPPPPRGVGSEGKVSHVSPSGPPPGARAPVQRLRGAAAAGADRPEAVGAHARGEEVSAGAARRVGEHGHAHSKDSCVCVRERARTPAYGLVLGSQVPGGP